MLDRYPVSHIILSIGDLLIVRISGIPSLGCPRDRLVVSSASVRCSGSGRHAVEEKASACATGTDVARLTLQIPHATVHSSLVAEAWLAWHSIPS